MTRRKWLDNVKKIVEDANYPADGENHASHSRQTGYRTKEITRRKWA